MPLERLSLVTPNENLTFFDEHINDFIVRTRQEIFELFYQKAFEIFDKFLDRVEEKPFYKGTEVADTFAIEFNINFSEIFHGIITIRENLHDILMSDPEARQEFMEDSFVTIHEIRNIFLAHIHDVLVDFMNHDPLFNYDGKKKAGDLYMAFGAHFPGVTDEDRECFSLEDLLAAEEEGKRKMALPATGSDFN